MFMGVGFNPAVEAGKGDDAWSKSWSSAVRSPSPQDPQNVVENVVL